MTTICGGGTSSPRPSTPAVLFLSGEAAVALAVETFGLSAAFASLLAFVAGQTFNMTTYCAGDPPSMPSFTAADVIAIVTSTPAVSPGAYQKAADLISIAVWYALCQCDSGAAPTTATPPTYPSGGPVVNPPGLPSSSAAPCSDQRTSITVPIPTATTPYYNLTDALLPTGGATHSDTPFTGFTYSAQAIAPGVTNLVVKATSTVASTQSSGQVRFLNAAGTGISANYLIFPSGAPTTVTYSAVTLPPGAAFWGIVAANGYPAQTAIETISFEATFYCGGSSPTTPVTPCCPPDPVLQAQLTQLINMVTLLQRQGAAFGYVPGSVHSVSGSGTITVADILGLSLSVTSSTPPGADIQAGDPDEYFGLGWFCWGTADGFEARQFVGHTDMLSLPRQAGIYTRIGYSLAPGVSADITELIREP